MLILVSFEKCSATSPGFEPWAYIAVAWILPLTTQLPKPSSWIHSLTVSSLCLSLTCKLKKLQISTIDTVQNNTTLLKSYTTPVKQVDIAIFYEHVESNAFEIPNDFHRRPQTNINTLNKLFCEVIVKVRIDR